MTAVSASASQPNRDLRSPLSSGRATWLSVAWTNVPWPGRPAARPLVSRSLYAFSTVLGLIASAATTSLTFGS